MNADAGWAASVPWASIKKSGEMNEDGTVATTADPGACATDEEAAVTAIKQTVTIQPGGRVEVISDELPEGWQAEVIILVDPSRSTRHATDPIGAGRRPSLDIPTADQSTGTRNDAGTSQTEGQPPEYPTAEFIKPTEYDWNIDKFIAEQAVREYLKDSHADSLRGPEMSP